MKNPISLSLSILMFSILRPLDEVEPFVNSNKHLPDVPSADEFKKQGINMAEMDNLLLQKIEELTLYIIQLEKKNKEQDELLYKLLKEEKD